MIVFAVHDGDDVVGVFSTLEDAKKSIEIDTSTTQTLEWRVVSYGWDLFVHTNMSNGSIYPVYYGSIKQFEVK